MMKDRVREDVDRKWASQGVNLKGDALSKHLIARTKAMSEALKAVKAGKK